MQMESPLRVTKGACPAPLLRNASLRLSQGCQRIRWAGVLGCLPSEWGMRRPFLIILDLGLYSSEEQNTSSYLSLQFIIPKDYYNHVHAEIQTVVHTIFGQKMIYIFKNWQYQLPFLIRLHFFVFCFVFTELLHDLSCVTTLINTLLNTE